MITEDYVSFETAKLLKEKGFNEYCKSVYHVGSIYSVASLEYHDNEGYGAVIEEKQNSDFGKYDNAISAPTLQMAMKWLREVHNVLVIPDYGYEFTYESYFYKIYKLGENGKPERFPMEGVRYDTLGIPYKEIVAYRDYKRSYSDYKTYEEACEAGIRHCLENLI